MSLVLKTLRAFPRGRTTEELIVLIRAGFNHDKRIAAIAELDGLLRDGSIEKGKDGRWRTKGLSVFEPDANAGKMARYVADEEGADIISGTAVTFFREPAPEDIGEEPESPETSVDPKALLRYWRSALRADPRGATTQPPDKHGIEWALISGRGPVVPDEGETVVINIESDRLPPEFREALVRREGNENGLAVGWPMAVGRRGGVPAIQPVGLLAATWERNGGALTIRVDADDILVNPDWVKAAARASGWRGDALAELFDAGGGPGLRAAEFLDRLRDAVASQVRGPLTGQNLKARLDLSSPGIHDSAAIFLPTDSSFTAGAARDLDRIAAWSGERLSGTAVSPILGLESGACPVIPAINTGPLNGEQLRAVRHACSEPLTVVTGPPGTGKSQAIVSMAASVLMSGGSVLVASRNHQALDAVEERLGALAPDAPFVTRTLNPHKDINTGFAEVAKQLVSRDHAAQDAPVDEIALARLRDKSALRCRTMDVIEERASLECEIADLLERIALRERYEAEAPQSQPPPKQHSSVLRRVVLFFARLFRRPGGPAVQGEHGAPATLPELKDHLEKCRIRRDAIAASGDPLALGEEIAGIARTSLPRIMAHRTHLTETHRREVADAYDDWTFSGGKSHPPADLSRSVIRHRPLWLASVLGAPKRIPLEAALFDLVIFDEASQCDIAAAIPLLVRARRAVVVGDDRQLSFIAGLGLAQDRNLMLAQNLPVAQMGRFAQSRRSLFDCASRVPGAARVTLRHQYRSAGDITRYISDDFYGGQLEPAYDPGSLVVPKGARPGLAWEHVPAPAIPPSDNVNPAEVTAITEHLKHVLLRQDYRGSIGVVTPFRAQVHMLEQAIRQAIPETRLIAAEFRAGTADGFQGQERDLILFSPCVGPRSPQSGLTFLQRDTRRLNVAISRARAVAMIFGDLGFARSGTVSALRRLAARATEARTKRGEGVFESDLERRVFHALKSRGLDPRPQYEIAGRRLDFALFGAGDIRLDLEVDGRRWHESQDGRRKTSDLWRDEQLKTLGWRVRRFWVDDLAKDMEGCLDIIETDLRQVQGPH